jgi:hypothetical protein
MEQFAQIHVPTLNARLQARSAALVSQELLSSGRWKRGPVLSPVAKSTMLISAMPRLGDYGRGIVSDG